MAQSLLPLFQLAVRQFLRVSDQPSEGDIRFLRAVGEKRFYAIRIGDELRDTPEIGWRPAQFQQIDRNVRFEEPVLAQSANIRFATAGDGRDAADLQMKELQRRQDEQMAAQMAAEGFQ